MKTTQKEALKKLEQYVNLPSGSYDAWDVEATQPVEPSGDPGYVFTEEANG